MLNIKFNKNKVQFRVVEVKYLGDVFNGAALLPDPERVKTIIELCHHHTVVRDDCCSYRLNGMETAKLFKRIVLKPFW